MSDMELQAENPRRAVHQHMLLSSHGNSPTVAIWIRLAPAFILFSLINAHTVWIKLAVFQLEAWKLGSVVEVISSNFSFLTDNKWLSFKRWLDLVLVSEVSVMDITQ